MIVGQDGVDLFGPNIAGCNPLLKVTSRRYCYIVGLGLEAMRELFQAGLDTIELNVWKLGQVVRNYQLQF